MVEVLFSLSMVAYDRLSAGVGTAVRSQSAGLLVEMSTYCLPLRLLAKREVVRRADIVFIECRVGC